MRELSKKEKIIITVVFISTLAVGGGIGLYLWIISSEVPVKNNNSPENTERQTTEALAEGSSSGVNTGKENPGMPPPSKDIKPDAEAARKFYESITQLEADPTSLEAPKHAAEAKKRFEIAKTSGKKGSPYYHESLEAPDLEAHFNKTIEAQLSLPNPSEVALKKVKALRQINPEAPNAFADKKDLSEIWVAFTQRKQEKQEKKSEDGKGKNNSENEKDDEETNEQSAEEVKSAAKKLLTNDINEICYAPLAINQVLALGADEVGQLRDKLDQEYLSEKSLPNWKLHILESNMELLMLVGYTNRLHDNKAVQAWAKKGFKIHNSPEFKDFIRSKLPRLDFELITEKVSTIHGYLIWFKKKEISTSWEGYLENSLANFIFRYVNANAMNMPEAYLESVIKFCSVTKEEDVQPVVEDLKTKPDMADNVKKSFTHLKDIHVDINRLYNIIVTRL